MKTGIIIQARMGSTRLPGKVMMPLPKDGIETDDGGRYNRKALEWTVESCLRTAYKVFIATSTNPEDDAIYNYFNGSSYTSVGLFRGSPDDVLDRLYQCAKLHQLDVIVRVTGDCPFIDPEVIRQVVLLRQNVGADYASNVDPPSWPDGLDIQCVTFNALERAHKAAAEPTDRDTVLQYIVRHRNEFSVANLPCPIGLMSVHRWVLDTESDYDICSSIASDLLKVGKGPGASFSEILPFAPEPQDRTMRGRNDRYLAARARELKVPDGGGDAFHESFTNGAVARRLQPYGASTYSKSFVAWGADAPLYLTHAQGSHVFDVDGNEYIDMTAALGTTILGHCDPFVRRAIERQLDLGIGFPLAHEREHIIAGNVIRKVVKDSNERSWKVVFGKNGSDVTSAAVRLARVVTGRPVVAMLKTGYHGWHDWALVDTQRGEGCYAGVCDYDVSSSADRSIGFKNLVGLEVAAVIVEPDQLTIDQHHELRQLCTKHGSLLIFDEMVTAFRYPNHTLTRTYDLDPDMICLGKALGNGMPITALVGRAKMMDKFVTKDGKGPYAFFSGTHFGEMVSLAAADAVLERMGDFEQGYICGLTSFINDKVTKLITKDHQDIGWNWTTGPVPKLQISDPDIAAKFRREMAHNGVLFYAAMLPTLMHTQAELEHVVNAMDAAFNAIKAGKARGKALINEKIMRS